MHHRRLPSATTAAVAVLAAAITPPLPRITIIIHPRTVTTSIDIRMDTRPHMQLLWTPFTHRRNLIASVVLPAHARRTSQLLWLLWLVTARAAAATSAIVAVVRGSVTHRNIEAAAVVIITTDTAATASKVQCLT
jgi:hypothetical protein